MAMRRVIYFYLDELHPFQEEEEELEEQRMMIMGTQDGRRMVGVCSIVNARAPSGRIRFQCLISIEGCRGHLAEPGQIT